MLKDNIKLTPNPNSNPAANFNLTPTLNLK